MAADNVKFAWDSKAHDLNRPPEEVKDVMACPKCGGRLFFLLFALDRTITGQVARFSERYVANVCVTCAARLTYKELKSERETVDLRAARKADAEVQ